MAAGEMHESTELFSTGCGRKLPPSALADLLASTTNAATAIQTLDDCGAFEASADPGSSAATLLQSVDVVMSMGLPPDLWGRIVALHCASDIYASGGVPKWALGIFSVSPEWIRKDWHKLAYGSAVRELTELGVEVVGGHTLRTSPVSLGFAITGTSENSKRRLRSDAAVGDILILTKPVGSSMVLGGHAYGGGQVTDAERDEVIESMLQSNRLASEAAEEAGAHSSTDVTGFGLVGSCLEYASATGFGVDVYSQNIPRFSGVANAVQVGAISPLAENILIDYEKSVDWTTLSLSERFALCDPQVSGGLLIAVDENRLDALLDGLRRRVVAGWVVGEIHAGCEGDPKVVRVHDYPACRLPDGRVS